MVKKTEYRRRRSWRTVATTLAAVAVFCTTYALILPAITMEKQPACDLREHTHEENCYTSDVVLSCAVTEPVVHRHNEICCREDGTLLCALPETEAHTHGADCFAATILTHSHDESCVTVTQGALLCTEAQEHSHSDSCWEWVEVLSCGAEEGQEIPSETVLICSLAETVPHWHNDSCYGEDGRPVCELTEIREHIHSEDCLSLGEPVLVCTMQEHVHDTVLCYIDNTADVETQERWEALLPQKLSGIWAEDLIAVAESQLGYTESEYNVQVDADGFVLGYTRYGAWYGEPYSDWNSIFVSFCLNYAKIDREDFPYESNAERWVTVLTAREQFTAEEGYEPVAGDLVFLDMNDNDYADLVAIVKAWDQGEEKTTLTVLLGDPEKGRVEQRCWTLIDPDPYPDEHTGKQEEADENSLMADVILGYGVLPQNPDPEKETESLEEFVASTEETVACDVLATAPSDAQGSETDPSDQRVEGDAAVIRVVGLIDGIPSLEEIREKREEFVASGDALAEEAWLTEVHRRVKDSYQEYSALDSELRSAVTNADKLMALEYIWSARRTIYVTVEYPTVNAVGEAANGDPDYYFNILTDNDALFIGPGSETNIITYRVMDMAGNILKNPDGTDQLFQVDRYGIFTLKAGQTAVFEGNVDSMGKFFVQELIRAEENDQYPVVMINGQETLRNEIVDWSSRTCFSETEDSGYDASDKGLGPYGYRWYGRSGYATDSGTDTGFRFILRHQADGGRLGSLSLTQQITSQIALASDSFCRLCLTLDGQPLMEGITVPVTGVDGTVTRRAAVGREIVNGVQVSYLDLQPGETAMIPNILSGTEFRVWESETTAEDWHVSYSQTGADKPKWDGYAASGIILANEDVAVTVTNTEIAARLQIPVIMRLRKTDEGTCEYTFTLTQTDGDGEKLADGIVLTQTLEFAQAENRFTFPELLYSAQEFEELPAKRYYLVEEEGQPETERFLVEVTVSRSGTEELFAEITKVSRHTDSGWEGEPEIAFTNTLLGDLTLGNTVKGVSRGQDFWFIVSLAPGDSGAEIPETIRTVLYHPDGTVQQETISDFSEGSCYVSLKSGTYMTFYGIPIGTEWTVTEGTAVLDGAGNFRYVKPGMPSGFLVSSELDGGETIQGYEVKGSIAREGTVVDVINTSTYELPRTGGAGTDLYTMGGLLLMASAALLLVCNQKKRRKEVF